MNEISPVQAIVFFWIFVAVIVSYAAMEVWEWWKKRR